MSVLINNPLKENFCQIPNALITDTTISFQARCLYCYIASQSAGWQIFNKVIMKKLGIKTDEAIAKYFKELIERGWLQRVKQKDEITGQFNGGYDYTLISALPKFGQNPNLDKPEIHNNTNLLNNTNNINNNNMCIGETKNTHKFIIPSLEEIKSYCEERNNGIDAEYFMDFYSSKGWMVGKNKMKDWRAAVRTWEKGNKKVAPAAEKNEPEEIWSIGDYLKQKGIH